MLRWLLMWRVRWRHVLRHVAKKGSVLGQKGIIEVKKGSLELN